MIEEIILTCLIESVSENAYCETPTIPPEEYILIERTAGSANNHIKSAMVAVQSISTESLLAAAKLNDAVIEALETLGEESSEIYSCKLNSNYNFSNPQTKEYRYQAVFDITY